MIRKTLDKLRAFGPAAFASLRKLRNVSQTTISGVVGALGMILYALHPYMMASNNEIVRNVAIVLAALGFGNASRAAADRSEALTADQLDGKPAPKPLVTADFVTHADGETVKREPGGPL